MWKSIDDAPEPRCSRRRPKRRITRDHSNAWEHELVLWLLVVHIFYFRMSTYTRMIWRWYAREIFSGYIRVNSVNVERVFLSSLRLHFRLSEKERKKERERERERERESEWNFPFSHDTRWIYYYYALRTTRFTIVIMYKPNATMYIIDRL